MQQISEKRLKRLCDWVWKVTHWELCKKFKFDHTNKWCVHNLEFVLENKTHTLSSGILRYKWLTHGGQTETIQITALLRSGRILRTLCQTTRPCDNKQKNRTFWIVDFVVVVDHKVKLKKNEGR